MDDAIEPGNARSTQIKGSETNPIEIDSGDESTIPGGPQPLACSQATSSIKTEVKNEVQSDAGIEAQILSSKPVAKRARVVTHDAPEPDAAEAANPTRAYIRATASRPTTYEPTNPIGTALAHPHAVSHPSPSTLLHEDQSRTKVSTYNSNWIHLKACAIVVYSIADMKWFMLRCSFCGANWSLETLDFFKSLRALHAHVKGHPEASTVQGVAAVLDAYVVKEHLDPQEALLISNKPSLVPTRFGGKLLRAVDMGQVPGDPKEIELRDRLDAILSTVHPTVRNTPGPNDQISTRNNKQRSRAELHADEEEDGGPRRSRRRCEAPTVAGSDSVMQDAIQDAPVTGLIPQEKIKLGERKGWHCLKACPVVVKHIGSGRWSLVICKTCRTNASRVCQSWYVTVNALYMHMAGHEGVASAEVKELTYRTVGEKHAHLIPLTEEEVLRIDARPHIVPMLIKGQSLELSWSLESSWIGSGLRVVRSGNWSVDGLARSLRATLKAQATKTGYPRPTDHVLSLHLPPNCERFRDLISKQTCAVDPIEQANITKATEARADSTYHSASLEPLLWNLESDSDGDDSDAETSLDSDTPIFPSGRLA